MAPILPWLTKLLLSKKFRVWLLGTLGPGAVQLFKGWLKQLGDRRSAIDHADQINGRFSVALIDGDRHVVVWKDHEPVSAYPPVGGDLSAKLRLHAREDLKDADDRPTRRAVRWVSGRIAHLGPGDDGRAP